MHRVVITGIGCLSSLGLSAPAHIAATREGRSGVAETMLVDPAKLQSKMVAELKGFDPTVHLDRKVLGMVDRVSELALVAAAEAIADSGACLSDGIPVESVSARFRKILLWPSLGPCPSMLFGSFTMRSLHRRTENKY